jgi:hypothetical protein
LLDDGVSDKWGSGVRAIRGATGPDDRLCAGLVRLPKRGRRSAPAAGGSATAVVGWLMTTVTELESCEHGKEDFALWISAWPGMLLCMLCYQAAQVLAEEIRWAACASLAGDPGRDAVVIAKVSDELGAHLPLATPARTLTSTLAGHRSDTRSIGSLWART